MEFSLLNFVGCMARLGLNWYGNLLVLLKNFLGIGDVSRTTHAFSAIGAKEEHHLLELGGFMRYDAVDISQCSCWEIRWLGIFYDCNPEESADRDAGNPQNCYADQRNSCEDAPARPFLVLGFSQLWNPRRIIRAVLYEIHDWSEQNWQHREWADILPTQHPVNVRSTTSHQFDIISEPSQTIHIADSNALKVIKIFDEKAFQSSIWKFEDGKF